MTMKEILPLPESTYQLLLDAARAWPDGVATQWIPGPADYTRCLSWTYAELAGTVTRIANALTALGVRRGDAVTLSSASTSMLYAATLAAQAVGIAAPVNPALSSERIAELTRRTGSRVLIAAGPELDPQLWARLLEVARQAGMTAVLALRPDDAHGVPPVLGPASDGGPDGRPLTVAYLDEVIAGQPSGRLAGADLPKAGDLAAFVHTGGTTGAPKVAAHTHANQLACGRGIAVCSGLAPGEAMLGGLPLFHVNALIVTGIAPMFGGARVVWPGPAGYRDKALYTRFWQIIEHYQIAAMSAVPTVYGTLAQVPVDADISTLRVPIVGASPLPASVREDFAAHTGRRLLEGYGLTEATCATTWTRPGEERPGSVGRVLPGQQIKAVTIGADGSWTDCGPGQTGVLVIGGPAVFAGYVTDPGLGGPRVSRDGIVHDGWLDTGDLGMVDAGGFVYLTGRAKDLIIRGGHNIDPRVIEDALLRHPGVRAAAAVGRPDRHSGEVPVAYVVPAGPGRFDETDLLAWAADAIDEAAARPKRIYPMTAIPVTEVGKPFKPALAADAAVRAITEALTAAGVADARVTAAHEDGRLVLTVTGADPGPRARRGRRIRPDRPLRAVARRTDHQQVTRRKIHDHERPLPRELPARHRRRRRPGRCTAALLLADFGIPVTLLERYPQPHPLPRAVHLDDEVARVLDRIGVGRGLPGPVPARQRTAPAGRQAPRDGRVPPRPAARPARLPAGQHVPPARPGRAAARPGRPAPADQPPARRRSDRAGLVPWTRSPRTRSGYTPASPASRRRSPAGSCWAATAPTARSASWPGSPWRTSASPSAGSWSTSRPRPAWIPGTGWSRSATRPGPPPSCTSPATGTAGSSSWATARTKPT